jgi:hypothetical protein
VVLLENRMHQPANRLRGAADDPTGATRLAFVRAVCK